MKIARDLKIHDSHTNREENISGFMVLNDSFRSSDFFLCFFFSFVFSWWSGKLLF